jgi:hypothetical protein
MQPDRSIRYLLAAIVLLLAAIAFRPFTQPGRVFAGQEDPQPFFFEPGTHLVRAPDGSAQFQGKIAIDLRTGDVWGFPTLIKEPYPRDVTSGTPPVSRPVHLGRFDLNAARR